VDIIPFITSDKSLFQKVTKLIKKSQGGKEGAVQLRTHKKTIEYLNIEMPELMLINFSDTRIDAYKLLDIIMRDSWLLHGAIIAICKEYKDQDRIENIRGANFIAVLSDSDLDNNLPKALTILENNRRILFQREIDSDLVSNISGSFKLNNDFLEAKCYVNLICNFLYNSNRLDIDKKFNLRIALNEMLINAIEHGNCNITYDEKTDWLAEHGIIDGLFMERMKDPSIAERKVTFEYTIEPTCSKFFIADEGDGFDWREVKDTSKEENLFELHGRGILMTKNVSRNITYNEKGNEVTFEIDHQKDRKGATPGLFQYIDVTNIKEGDIIFKEGEPSDYLYYIVSGEYNIIVKDTIVSSLYADDIFMGEMSFLLNNKRSATVVARSEGKLIKVSKMEFITAIKKKPHYALFLSRLLAQRIQRSNLERT
jgi:anti-sigma regulatory factor (Ser/Thr protein kinase)